MKVSAEARKAPAFKPMQAVVRNALGDADHDMRQLLLKTAILREFDSAVLSRIAGRETEDPLLAETVALYVPANEVATGTYRYDELTREALLSVVVDDQDERVLEEAAQMAAGYYHELAGQSPESDREREYERLAILYGLLADPEKGFRSWVQAWEHLPEDEHESTRQADLVQIAEQVWPDLAQVPGAQVSVLIKKGWLAYDLDDWQTAADTFWKVLPTSPDQDVRHIYYLSTSQTGRLMDGYRDYRVEAEANIGLGYVALRRGAYSMAARHFEKATWLISPRRVREDVQVAKERARALVGLGEACMAMGAPEDMLLRRLLLPADERRKLLHEYRPSETPPLEDMSLAFLLDEARRLFNEALGMLPETSSGTSLRLRTEALLARVLLEQGNWEEAKGKFTAVLEQELTRGGLLMEDLTSPARLGDLRLAKRMARINLYLGDCHLLASRAVNGDSTPIDPADSEQAVTRSITTSGHNQAPPQNGTVNGSTGEYDQAAEAEAKARYRVAHSLYKKARRREGIALALRRQGDLEVLRSNIPGRRALSRYIPSLELYEQTDNPTEIAVAQERIELLRDRVGRQIDGPGSTREGAKAAPDSAGQEADETKTVLNGETRALATIQEFQDEVDSILGDRRRFFRYRIARRLVRRLRWIYRFLIGLVGLVIGGILYWLVWVNIPWLGQTSERVTSLPWSLTALITAFVAFLLVTLVERSSKLRKVVIARIPRRWFWLGQDQLAIDALGLHRYDSTDRRTALLQWSLIRDVRSQTWKPIWNREGPKGAHTVVVGGDGTTVKFTNELRGYGRLLDYIRQHLANSGDAARFYEPVKTQMHGNFLPFTVGCLMYVLILACLLTLLFAFIPPITRFGPPTFATAGGIAGLLVILLLLLKFFEWRYVHPFVFRNLFLKFLEWRYVRPFVPRNLYTRLRGGDESFDVAELKRELTKR